MELSVTMAAAAVAKASAVALALDVVAVGVCPFTAPLPERPSLATAAAVLLAATASQSRTLCHVSLKALEPTPW